MGLWPVPGSSNSIHLVPHTTSRLLKTARTREHIRRHQSTIPNRIGTINSRCVGSELPLALKRQR